MFQHHRIFLAILLGFSRLFRVADANLNQIKSSNRKDDVYEIMMRSLVEQANNRSAVIQPNFNFEDGPCTCPCEVEPGTEGVIFTIQDGIGGNLGMIVNFCVPVEYEQYIFDLFEALSGPFPLIPDVGCAPSDACPTDEDIIPVIIPVPLPDPYPECECPCGEDKVEDGVIVKAQPWMFHLCIPASWSAFFLFVPSVVFPLLQLPSTDFTCADATVDEKRAAKGCPTKLVIPLPLPPLPDMPAIPTLFP